MRHVTYPRVTHTHTRHLKSAVGIPFPGNESRHIDQCAMSHISMCLVIYPRVTYTQSHTHSHMHTVTSKIARIVLHSLRMSHVPRINQQCQICQCVMSHIHVLHTHSHLENSAGGVLLQENESCPVYQSVMSHISMRHVTHACVTYRVAKTHRIP